LEDGKVTHPDRGSPQGGVISPLLSNVMLHEVDRQWHDAQGDSVKGVRLVRYADDMVLRARSADEAQEAWTRLQARFGELRSSERLDVVIRKLNPVLNGWCTYFRVGNSNRVFHAIDWTVRSELQLWLRRKHRCSWRSAKGRWHYRFLHERGRRYGMVGKVSHLEALQRTLPEQGCRRAGCGESARPVR